jgi:short-subunit dehydrogenase
MNVALAARSAGPIEELARELSAHGSRAVAIPTDVANASELARLVERAEREIGPTDVLVNNAGIEQNGAYTTFSEDELARMIDIDLVSPMRLTRKVLPGMLERKRGHVVNISSLAGKAAVPFNVPYGAAKAGLVGLSHGLRAELRGTGVSASVVCPGYVSEAGMFADKQREHGVRAPKMLGTSSPDEVARAVIRAIKDDVVEIIVNPGPMRVMQAVSQLFPALPGWLANRIGVGEMFRQVGEARRG